MIYNNNEELNKALARSGIQNIEIESSSSLTNVGTIGSSTTATLTVSADKVDTMINTLGSIETYKETVRRTLDAESLSDSEICSPDFIEKLPSKIIRMFCKDLVKLVLDDYNNVACQKYHWKGANIYNYDPFHLISILLQAGALKQEDLDCSPEFLKQRVEDYSTVKEKEEQKTITGIRLNGEYYPLNRPITEKVALESLKDLIEKEEKLDLYKAYYLGNWNICDFKEVNVEE